VHGGEDLDNNLPPSNMHDRAKWGRAKELAMNAAECDGDEI
jgi:hypothetical protein